MFGAELADLGHRHRFEALADAIVVGGCLGDGLDLAREDVLLAHLEVHATVLLYGLVDLAGRVAGGQERRVAGRVLLVVGLRRLDELAHHVCLFFRLVDRGEVGVAEGLSCGDPVIWGFLEHPHQQVQSLRIHLLVLLCLEGNVACSVLRQDLVVSLAGERADPQHQDMEDEAQAEDIADGVVFGLHVLDVDDLRSHVARSAAPDEEILLSIGELSQSEVSNDAVPASLSPEDEVLRLEVAMHDALGVHFLEPLQDGVHDELDLEGLELVFRLDLVIELPAFQQLHHDVKRVLGLEDLMQLHAVLVIEIPHDFYLLDEALLSFVLTVGCLLGKSLHGVVSPALQLLREVNRGEVALPDFLLGFELLMEAPLVELALQNFPAGLEIGLALEGKLGPFLLLFEVDGEGREGEAVLEIEVEEHDLLEPEGGFGEALLVEGQGHLSFGLAMGRAREKQLARVVRELRAEHWADCFHFNIIQKYTNNLLYSISNLPVFNVLVSQKYIYPTVDGL